MSGSLCFLNLCVRKFCRAYISINHLVKGQGDKMGTMLLMSGRTFAKFELAAFAVGVGITGVAAWLCNRWDRSYAEAKEAGVVM